MPGEFKISKVISLPVRSFIYGNASLEITMLITAANKTKQSMLH